MSSFWKEVKQTFSNPKPELDETTKAILDIENKKKTITQASKSEQDTIRGKIDDAYRSIGETAYTLYESGDFEIEKIAEMFQTVKDLYQTLDEKRAKLNEIIGRYDEELKILQPAPPAGQAICPNCGNSYIPGEMLYCNKCGTKLPEKVSDVDKSEPVPVQQLICPNCNTVLTSDAVFCASCGKKL